MFSANCAPILHQHQHCLQMDQNEIPHDPHHLIVPSGASKMISEAMVCSQQIVHLYSIKIRMDWIELPLEPHLLGVPSGASKMISETTERSAHSVHLSCIKIATISTWTKSSIHMSLVTKEYHGARPKWFLSLWYVWRKLCTYLAPTPTQSLNWPKRDSTWPTSPWSSIGCVQNDF
jgi:hypothetical protein